MNARDELDAVLKLRGLNDRERRAALDAYRAEVLDEQTARDAETMLRAADWLEGIGQHHAAEMLRYEAAGDERDTQPADFFQPGHTYTDSGEYDWQFRVDTITTHPEDGERTALGWRHFNGAWEPYAYGEDDWDVHQHVGHTYVTETGGESRG